MKLSDFYETIEGTENIPFETLNHVEQDRIKVLYEKYMNSNYPKTHILKTERKFFTDIKNGYKKFELRFNDRNFQVGDLLELHETVKGRPTGDKIRFLRIKYILMGDEAEKYGLKKGYCILNW